MADTVMTHSANLDSLTREISRDESFSELVGHLDPAAQHEVVSRVLELVRQLAAARPGENTDAQQLAAVQDARAWLAKVSEDAPTQLVAREALQLTELDREALALSLWDEGVVRPEGTARAAVDHLLAHPFLAGAAEPPVEDDDLGQTGP